MELGLDINQAGLEESPIEQLTTPALVQSLIIFSRQFNIHLHHNAQLKPQHERDLPIMQFLFEKGASSKELASVNLCHLYLRVYFLSDIVMGDGIEISEDFWQGNREERGPKSSSWSQVSKPPSKDWTTWKEGFQ